MTVDDLTLVRRATGKVVVKEDGGRFAAIDPVVTPALRQEGVARELVSRVQRLRKELGFAVSDRITVALEGPAEVEEAARLHKQWIMDEVLAREFAIGGALDLTNPAVRTLDLDGIEARVALNRDA